MVARLGVQIEFVQKQLSSRIPSFAMRSMLGVSVDAAAVGTDGVGRMVVAHYVKDVRPVGFCHGRTLLSDISFAGNRVEASKAGLDCSAVQLLHYVRTGSKMQLRGRDRAVVVSHAVGKELALPIYLTSVGYRPQFAVERPDGLPDFHWLHTVRGSGVVELGGATRTLREGQGFLMFPGVPPPLLSARRVGYHVAHVERRGHGGFPVGLGTGHGVFTIWSTPGHRPA